MVACVLLVDCVATLAPFLGKIFVFSSTLFEQNQPGYHVLSCMNWASGASQGRRAKIWYYRCYPLNCNVLSVRLASGSMEGHVCK